MSRRTSAPIDEVGALLVELGVERVLPRFRTLQDGDVGEKAPGDLVTVVDHEIEEELSRRLAGLVPGSRVIGEEGVWRDPSLLAGLAQGWVWVVDPLDGTANFVEGRPDFALMVGLLRDGESVAAWIHSPTSGSLASAESGGGARLNGKGISVDGGTRGEPRRMAMTGYLPPEVRAAWERHPNASKFVRGTGSAGVDYLDFASGRWACLFYWRTLPWDHVHGSLLVQEAGGHVARPDGTAYHPWDGRFGLLSAASEGSWTDARGILPL